MKGTLADAWDTLRVLLGGAVIGAFLALRYVISYQPTWLHR